MEWRAATIEEVKEIVRKGLAKCDSEQLAVFQRYSVEPYLASILRNEKMEKVVVVAQRGDEVIYWEDVEEGFNRSPIGPDGRVLEHSCNQDELPIALNSWIEARTRLNKG